MYYVNSVSSFVEGTVRFVWDNELNMVMVKCAVDVPSICVL
jgi:hypothetical protein